MKHILKFLFFLNLAIIIGFWWDGSGSLLSGSIASIMLALGRLSGLLGVYFVLLQFVFIGRIVFIERVLGHDHLARIHHKFGKYALVFIILHFFLILNSYASFGKVKPPEQIIDFLQNYDGLTQAFIAFNLFIVVVVSSLAIVRLRLKYEMWYFVHLVTYLAVLLAFTHQLDLGGDFANRLFALYWYLLYAAILGGFIASRFVRPIRNFIKHQFFVEDVVKETDNVYSIFISGKQMEQFERKAGQFITVRFLDWRRFWEAHPFSISWGGSHMDIRITPKASGDFTSKIHLIKPGTKVYIDGPLGVFTKDQSFKSKILLIAGGVGITPIRALIEEIGEQKKDMILLYSNKNEKDIVFKKELSDLSKKYKLEVIHIITEDLHYKGEKGRIDHEKIKRLVSDIKERDIYLCGPVPFMDAVIAILRDLGVDKDSVHFEKFTLH